MQFTIHVPWLTRVRRLAIGLSFVLALIAMALPASAAAPEGIEGQVTVINDPDQPVPITGDVTGSVEVSGTVTVSNDTTDPLPVTGTVGLAASEAADLSSIEQATSGLSYDGSGNLNVNLAAGSGTSAPVVTIDALFGTGGVFAELIASGDTDSYSNGGVDAHITTLWVSSFAGPIHIDVNRDGTTVFHIFVDDADDGALTFPAPILADSVELFCNDSSACSYTLSVAGY